MARVTVSIVTYKDYAKARETIKSVLENTRGVDCEIYIVDNASGENVALLAKDEFPGVKVITAAENRGYGAGHNEVMPYLDSEYYAVLNPDITLVGDVLSDMVRMMDENPDIGIACPKILNPDGTEQYLPKKIPTVRYLMAGRMPGMHKIRDEYTRADENLTEITDIDFVTGCFMFMRTELFKKVGGFDTSYFMYLEDADLGREIQKYARSVYYPGASAVHEWSRADKKDKKLLKAHIDSVFIYMKKWKEKESK